MANIIGNITIDQMNIFELDGNPLASGGTPGIPVGSLCIIYGSGALYNKTGSGDTDFLKVNPNSGFSSQATTNATLVLTNVSDLIKEFTGTTAGQIVQMPDATTLEVGTQYLFYNNSTQSISFIDGNSGSIVTLSSNQRLHILLKDKSSVAGTWLYYLSATSVGSGSDYIDTSISQNTLAGNTSIGVSTSEQEILNRIYGPTVSRVPVFAGDGTITSVTFYSSSSQVTANRIAVVSYTYDGNLNPATETTILYSTADGTTVLKTITKTFTFTSGVLTNVTQVTT